MDMSGTPETEDTPEIHREKSRESTFLTAAVVFDGSPQQVTARVRNVSSGGMMIDTGTTREKGLGVTVQLKNVGEVRGTVAWSTSSRMGITFENEIDPHLARHKPAAAPIPGYGQPHIQGRRPGLAIR